MVIKNAETWIFEKAPECIKDFLSRVRLSEKVEKLNPGKLYAQYLRNPESGTEIIHVVYYTPNMAKEFHYEDAPFWEEFFLSFYPPRREIFVRYVGRSFKLEEASGWEEKTVEIDEGFFRLLTEELKKVGFFSWQENKIYR
jgi:hypothetical protein